MKIAEKISYLRKRANLSQEEFAEKLYVSRQTVSKWESGKSIPDTDNVVLISKLFGVSLEELFYDEVEISASMRKKERANEETATGAIKQPKEALIKESKIQDNEELLKRRQRDLMICLIIGWIYVIAMVVYFMIVRLRRDIRLDFIVPTVIGALFFTCAILGVHFSNRRSLNLEQKLAGELFFALTISCLAGYGISTFIAGNTFLSQFPHFEPVGFFGILLFIGVYPIQLFIPHILIKRVISVFLIKVKKDVVTFIKSCAKFCIILACSCFVCVNTFYRIEAAIGMFDWAYSENISVLWNYLDNIFLVSLGITLLCVLPCISLIRACVRYEKYGVPLKKGRFRFLYFSAILYLILVFIGNWITMSMFYTETFWGFTFGLIFNLIPPALTILGIFAICEKYKDARK